MIRKIRQWLITSFLPERACAAVDREIEHQRRQLEEVLGELERINQERARLESYIYGLERALRSQRVDITVRGGATWLEQDTAPPAP